MLFCITASFLTAFSAGAESLEVAPYLPAVSNQKDWSAPITVQYPTEKMTAPYGAKNVYLFGKLNLPEPTLEINGSSVTVRSNGTFIAYLPVQQGTFEFVLTATSQGQTYQALRHIKVPGTPLEDLKGKARFDENHIYPAKAVWVLPGETIQLSARGTPGAKVTATLDGLTNNPRVILKENANRPGSYQAAYVINKQEKPHTAKVIYQLNDPKTNTHTKTKAKKTIKVLDPQQPLQPARVKDPGVKLRQLPVHQGSLYPFYRTYGEVLIDRRDNGLYRLQLGNGETAWLEEKKLDLFSASAYQPNTLQQLHTFSDEIQTRISWNGQKQVPVSIREFSDRLEVIFYYTDSFEEDFDFDATSPLLDHIAWEDPQEGHIKFILFFKPDQLLWGYSYQYEDNVFSIGLRHPPVLRPSTRKPLLGARILLDAGHSPKRTPPYDGLVSPSGFLEYEANLALAEILKPKLEAAGATVIMTRHKDNEMSLPDRYQKALEENAHLFISLHHNALPETTDPFARPLGYSIYYTYPHSFKLGQSIHQSFQQHVSLPDNGLIANDVLFIPRISDIPSVLIENAYMILPEQEELVMSKEGRQLFAQTIYDGILTFYKTLPHAVYPFPR